MKKIIALFLSVTLFCSYVPAMAQNDEIGTIVGCKYDTYFENGRNESAYEDSGVMLAGTVYGRKPYLVFDITDYVDSGFVGCVLNLTVRNIAESSTVSICSYDTSAKREQSVISKVTFPETGKITQGFNISDYVVAAAALGKKEIALTVNTTADSMTVFSSQASKESDRPSLTFTGTSPYVQGQIEMELPELTKEELELKLKTPIAKGHPYLFGTKAQFDRVRENAFGKDELMTKTYADIKAVATDYLSKKPQPIDLATSYISRGIEGSWTIVPFCAFVYLIEGDEAYAQRAWKEAEYFLGLENYGTYQYLDINQAALIVAICYDWLYDWLTPDQRQQLTDDLKAKHLDLVLDFYRNNGTTKFPSRFNHIISASNHGVLNNSSIFIQALAIAELDPAYSAEIMSYAMHYMNVPLYELYPDSLWPEGYDYWGYVGPMALRAVMSMKSAFGDALGYEKSKVFMNNAYHPIYLSTKAGTFQFNDGFLYVKKNVVYDKFIYGVIGDNEALQKYSIDNDDLTHPFFCLYYDPSVDYSSMNDLELEKDRLFRNVDLAIMRSSWNGDQYLFGGMLVQDSMPKQHRHMNSGSLSFHALGEMWITNPGKDDYGLPGYSSTNWFDYYCKRAESSNCIVINPSDDGGQAQMAGDVIDEFKSKDRGAYAISDLTNTYAKYGATSYKRGVMLGNDRTSFTVQDELSLEAESEVYSFINFYQSDITISSDGKSAVISKNGKKLLMQVVCDGEYTASVMKSLPLPTSPNMPGQSTFEEIKKIAFHFEKTKGYNMTLVFTPYLADEELAQIPDATFVPLSEWSIPDGELVAAPALTDLKVNGATVDGFHPEARCYEIITEETEADVVPTAPSGYSAEVRKNDTTYTVYLKDGDKLVNTYIVRLTAPQKEPEPEQHDLTGLTKINVISATATDDDGNTPDGAIDNDTYTRWSASGEHSITFKLAKPVNVSTLGIAFYNGQKRSSYFDVQVSNDGKSWKTISKDNASCGYSDKTEYFDIKPTTALYIRLLCHGNSVNEWNSITEFEVYYK